MAKQQPWFKHHTGSSKTIKMMRMKKEFDHWGSGIYWEVCEVLRDQQGYKFEHDEFALGVLADLIGVKDENRFRKWFADCIKIGLLVLQDAYFFSPGLLDSMKALDTSKLNGSKGGRPVITKKKTKSKTKPITNPKTKGITIREDKIREDIIEEGSLPHPSEEFRLTWLKLRGQKKWKGKSPEALELSLEKLADVSEEDAIQMMKNSIEGNWQGLFPLDEKIKFQKQQLPSKGFTVRSDAN